MECKSAKVRVWLCAGATLIYMLCAHMRMKIPTKIKRVKNKNKITFAIEIIIKGIILLIKVNNKCNNSFTF
jgi:hypothetical protein